MLKRSLKLTLSLVILSTFAGAIRTLAQGTPAEERDLSERSLNLSLLRTGKASNKSSKKAKSSDDPKKVLAQVQEDFTRIQLIVNELVEGVRTGVADTASIGKSAAEVNTRAVRLMEVLTESRLDKKASDSVELLTDVVKMKESVYTLDSLIAEFANNKVFKEASPDDDKLAAQALRSLDQIIKLSGQISLSAQKVNKSP
jgi:hypothetical protein